MSLPRRRAARAAGSGAVSDRARALDAADVSPEVGRDDQRVVTNLFRAALGDHPARFEAVDAVADLHHERHVVLDEQHRGVELAPDLRRMSGPNASVSRCASPAVGSSRQQHPRVEREQARQLDDAARAGRQVGDELVGVAAEADVPR